MTRARPRLVTVAFSGAVTAVVSVAVVLSSCAGDSSPSDAGNEREAAAASDGSGSNTDAPLGDAGRDGEDVAPLVDTCGSAAVSKDAWVADPHLCLTVYASALPAPRQMAFAPNADLFVLAGGFVIALFDKNNDGVIGADERTTYSDGSLGLTHGLAFSPDGAFLYASSESAVMRWPYAPGDRLASGSPQLVIRDMPMGGAHFSRTLAFDKQGHLYVNVGSEGDVDVDPPLNARRAQVRRFSVPASIPDGGVPYDSGDVFASGLRNEVGLAFDSKGRMWGVENGSDGLYQSVASEVLDDNPAEEINLLDAPGARFYGYPYCWTEHAFDGGMGSGTQWAYGLPSPQTDSWCRDPQNVQPPAGAMPGHWAPLGVTEYAGGSLPWSGDLFVTAHGSSGRAPPVGRLIARAHLVGDKVVSVLPVAGHLVDGGLEEGTWDARPVDIRVGPEGALYFSDDLGGRVFRLGYRP